MSIVIVGHPLRSSANVRSSGLYGVFVTTTFAPTMSFRLSTTLLNQLRTFARACGVEVFSGSRMSSTSSHDRRDPGSAPSTPTAVRLASRMPGGRSTTRRICVHQSFSRWLRRRSGNTRRSSGLVSM